MPAIPIPSLKDILEAAGKAYDFVVGEGKDVEFEPWDSDELANEEDLKKKLAEAAKADLKIAVEGEGGTFEEDKVLVQVETLPAKKKSLKLERHARIMGKLFTCLELPFTVRVEGGTFQIFYDGTPASPVGHWVSSIHLSANGNINTTALAEGKISVKCSGTVTAEGQSHEVAITFSGGKGRGALVWNPTNSTDKFEVGPDGAIEITPESKHLS